ncbi:hypothetical protein CGH99_17905 [Vibrio parahaemolyticus]|uniref:hypothetical protein n=1 Tax=Vibrio parahaemolyticus TaxID=670 RepID=UPI001120537D|nr:hypothetical protein [Vibrio parahaemolyticus]TOL39306.1 hypothetical protein CGH99_17905 [Vibrio parahaemolyticus]TOL43988.1 hypothetical protein CGH98_21065 [Vibrio parahaemolyticus]TOL49113.1 hypothetical protein CGH96_20125 [Vibrio parahaemolyticus]TOL73724.1 hypothetical protein CGH92_09905 [Vibrio parahaemolyticus]TON27902.1 hypothetical protein CGH62_20270 [Vibrio parahaemolyticus]
MHSDEIYLKRFGFEWVAGEKGVMLNSESFRLKQKVTYETCVLKVWFCALLILQFFRILRVSKRIKNSREYSSVVAEMVAIKKISDIVKVSLEKHLETCL